MVSLKEKRKRRISTDNGFRDRLQREEKNWYIKLVGERA